MDKKYRIGFTAGVFDMFHKGHLALLRRCKESCSYLIVGVMTDEFTKHNKGRYPVISQEDRMEILKSIKYVDEVVFVDEHNTCKPDAWDLYHFDCCYTGDDHATPDWFEEQRILREKGSELIFLPYTKDVSSTKIRSAIIDRSADLFLNKTFYGVMRDWLELKMTGTSVSQWLCEHGYKKIAIYGAGRHGAILENDLKETNVSIAYWIDRKKSGEKQLYSPDDELPSVDAVIITPRLEPGDIQIIQTALGKKLSCPVFSLEGLINSVKKGVNEL